MRNAKATQERILAAATAEFSAYGIAGARVDRIAKTAECNKNLIYMYFESKEKLFSTVLAQNLSRVYETSTFSPDDLPGYAMQVFDFAMEHPDMMRLMAWFSLEHKTGNPAERDAAHFMKTDALLKAQKDGLINAEFSPDFLLTIIMVIATAWTAVNPFGPSLDQHSLEDRNSLRNAIARSVELVSQCRDER